MKSINESPSLLHLIIDTNKYNMDKRHFSLRIVRMPQMGIAWVKYVCVSILIGFPGMLLADFISNNDSLKNLFLQHDYLKATQFIHSMDSSFNSSTIPASEYYFFKAQYHKEFYRQDSVGYYLALSKRALAKKPNDSVLAFVEFNLGLWHISFSNTDASLQNFQKANALFEVQGMSEWQIKAMGNIGISSFLKGDTLKAMQIFQSILDQHQKNVNPLSYCNLLQNLGRFYIKTGKLDLATYYLDSCLNVAEVPLESEVKANALRGIGDVFRMENDLQNAIVYYEKADRIYQNLELVAQQLNGVYIIMNMYDSLRDLNGAYLYANRYTQLLVENYNTERAKTLGMAQAELLDVEKSTQIEILKSEIKMKEAQGITKIALIGFLVLLIIFLIVKWRDVRKNKGLEKESFEIKTALNKVEKNKLKQELELKRKALTRESMRLIEKNDQARQLQEKLSELSHKLPNEYSHKIDRVNSDFKTLIKLENNWEEFALYFEELHPETQKLLNEHISSLTIKEKRLASLLCLELNTREVSSILGISPDSVKKAKTRLRKKMKIDSNNSIRQQIMG